ncbi:hypothetical protein BKA80DRAFT_265013 [Phyllosticta citrichinensis]
MHSVFLYKFCVHSPFWSISTAQACPQRRQGVDSKVIIRMYFFARWHMNSKLTGGSQSGLTACLLEETLLSDNSARPQSNLALSITMIPSRRTWETAQITTGQAQQEQNPSRCFLQQIGTRQSSRSSTPRKESRKAVRDDRIQELQQRLKYSKTTAAHMRTTSSAPHVKLAA